MQWLALISVVSQLFMVARFVAGAIAAVCAYRHAARRVETRLGFPPAIWAAVIFAEPALGLLVYWLVYRRAPLRPQDDELVD